MIYMIVGTTLIAEIIIIATLVSLVRYGYYKRYPLFFAYLVVVCLTSIVDVSVYARSEEWANFYYRQYYWANEALRQLAGYVLVVSLIELASKHSPHRGRIGRWLFIGTTALVLFSWFYYREANTDMWMTIAARNISFLAVALNFLLWSLLIRSKTADRKLLIVSGALGLQMAGDAIGQSLRQISRTTEMAGNLIMVFSYLLGLVIWLAAFWKAPIANSESSRRQSLRL
jgi:hypothetical protein